MHRCGIFNESITKLHAWQLITASIYSFLTASGGDDEMKAVSAHIECALQDAAHTPRDSCGAPQISSVFGQQADNIANQGHQYSSSALLRSIGGRSLFGDQPGEHQAGVASDSTGIPRNLDAQHSAQLVN